MNDSLVAIALGSNLGNSWQILEGALEALAANPDISLQKRSSWYLTKAIGPPQPDYLNGCAIASTTLNPEVLLTALQDIENRFDRVRAERWGPRTLDLDLLLYADTILNTPYLQIPHPRMYQRAFVLVPLAEIAPSWVDPVSQLEIRDLLPAVDTSEVILATPQLL